MFLLHIIFFPNIFRKQRLNIDILLLIEYIISGSGAVVLCIKGYNTNVYLPVLRATFYL